MLDFLIVGGGVIGMSLAWQLSRRGQRVAVVDRDSVGRATSWVGAGIFPPPHVRLKHDPLEQLRCKSHELHVEWSAQLKTETGVDNELLQCGGVYLARQIGESVALRVAMQQAADEGVRVEELTIEQLVELEPALTTIADQIKTAYLLPDEMQLRSPKHMAALRQVCTNHAQIYEGVEVERITIEADAVSVWGGGRQLRARQCCLCTGPWAAKLLEPLGFTLPVEPWRGQLLVWQSHHPLVSRVVNEGLRYLVPRRDGRLLVGATVEDVGFDNRTTEEAIRELTAYARELLPELGVAPVQRALSGLRPKTPDGVPFMGRVPGCDRLSVATGHYRSGLHVAPATAVFMTQLLLDDKTFIDPTPFRLHR